MTISQAYYRIVFEEEGLTEKAFDRCAFTANLIVSMRVDELIEKLNPTPIKIDISYFKPSNEHFWLTSRWGMEIYPPKQFVLI